MSTEEILKEKCRNNSDLLVLSGSRLYGMSNSLSDYDYRGVILPPYEYLLNIKKFEVIEFEDDYKVFSLKRFLKLVIKGSPGET